MARELAALRDRMNRLFDESLGAGNEPATWVPPADMYRARDRVVVTLELPGVDDYEVTVESATLWVRGHRPTALGPGQGALQLERSYGRFERAFPLPADARGDKRRVGIQDGVLRIEIPIE